MPKKKPNPFNLSNRSSSDPKRRSVHLTPTRKTQQSPLIKINAPSPRKLLSGVSTPVKTPNRTPVKTPLRTSNRTPNRTSNRTGVSTGVSTPVKTPSKTPSKTPNSSKTPSSSKTKYIVPSGNPKNLSQDQQEKLKGYKLIHPKSWGEIPVGSHIRYIGSDNNFRTGGFIVKFGVKNDKKYLVFKAGFGYKATTFAVYFNTIKFLWAKELIKKDKPKNIVEKMHKFLLSKYGAEYRDFE